MTNSEFKNAVPQPDCGGGKGQKNRNVCEPRSRQTVFASCFFVAGVTQNRRLMPLLLNSGENNGKGCRNFTRAFFLRMIDSVREARVCTN